MSQPVVVVFVVSEELVEWDDLPWRVRAATPYEKWPLTALQARDQWYLDAESNGCEFSNEDLADWRQVDMAITYLEDLAYQKKWQGRSEDEQIQDVLSGLSERELARGINQIHMQSLMTEMDIVQLAYLQEELQYRRTSATCTEHEQLSGDDEIPF